MSNSTIVFVIILILFVLIILRPRKKQNITIDIEKQKSFGNQSVKYYQGYIRATEVIRNGSDADTLLNQAQSWSQNDDWDKGFKDACEYHIEKKNKVLAAHRTGITPEDENLLNTQS